MTNDSQVNYQKCYEMGVYEPDEPVASPPLLWFAVVHCYSVFVFGTICNGVAVWCIVTCTRIRPAVKVLLCSVFLPLLVNCLVTTPVTGQVLMSFITCDDTRVPQPLKIAMSLTYSCLAQIELVCIAALSIFRAVAALSPQRHAVRLRVAVGVVVGIFLYSLITGLGLLGSLQLGYIHVRWMRRGIDFLYFFLNTMIPVLVTIICYALMLFTVRRNKQRLASSQHRGNGGPSVVHQATRSMVAVFVSNLILSFPHSVFHLLEKQSMTLSIVFHSLFYTHFIVDPVVFVWFNGHHHQRVSEWISASLERMKRCCRSFLSFHLHSPSTSSTTLGPYEKELGGTDNVTMC